MKKDFSNEEIIKVALSLGSEDYKSGNNQELIFQTICHNHSGGSYKLYFYPVSGLFHCYTDCGDSFDVYELVKRNREYNFMEAKIYVYNLLGISSQRHGFVADNDSDTTEDWEIFNKYNRRKKIKREVDLPHYPKTLVQYHKRIYPIEWLAEGILPRSMDKFQIRYDLLGNKIIIPHFDIDGNLIGIRGRALNQDEIDRGGKYKPIAIQGDVLKHPTSYNLYGLHKNKKAIQAIRKIMILEAEKSVLKCDGFYGKDNFTVACCGGSVSNHQFEMILKLRVNEVFIAFDNERLTDIGPPPPGATREEKDAHARERARVEEYNRRYWDRLYNLAYQFAPYAVTYLICSDDENGLLDYKDAPCDKGQEVFEQLMKNKLEIRTKGEDDEYTKQWQRV